MTTSRCVTPWAWRRSCASRVGRCACASRRGEAAVYRAYEPLTTFQNYKPRNRLSATHQPSLRLWPLLWPLFLELALGMAVGLVATVLAARGGEHMAGAFALSLQ